MDVDLCGTGDDAPCGPRVVVRGPPTDDAAVARILDVAARTVAAVQGDPLDTVWAQWVDAPPGRVLAPR